LGYALAIAAKTFPVFVLPWFLRRGRVTAMRVLVAGAGVILALSAPYLVSSPQAFASDLLYSANHLPGGLSWQVVFHGLPVDVQHDIANVTLLAFLIAIVSLAWVDDLEVYSAVVFLLFIVFSKPVIEQYLTWPIPLLALLAVDRGSRSAALVLAVVTTIGMLVNPYIHPLGTQPLVIDLLLLVVVVAGSARLLLIPRSARAQDGAGRAITRHAENRTADCPARSW
jgi:hypothetical protein